MTPYCGSKELKEVIIGPHANYTWMVATIPVGIAVVWPITGMDHFEYTRLFDLADCVLLGSLSDTLGRRYFFLVGLTSSIIGGIIACTAQSVPVVIVGTAFIGVGTAIQQMIIAAMSEIYPNKYRGYAQGNPFSPESEKICPYTTIASITAVSAPFSATGPVISHLLIVHLNWRWAFYIAIIINSVAFVLLAIFYHPVRPNFSANLPKTQSWGTILINIELQPIPHREQSRLQLLKQTDWVGLGLFAVSHPLSRHNEQSVISYRSG